jgi:CDP-diacylglycerol--glycerol-3-phosphate 3-phosphatidyltransferase
VARAPLTFRRLAGLDRSGPPPPQTLKGAPLNPWTVPNVIAFARLIFIPVFLVVALSSDDGHSATAAALFALIGWSDYLDGITARVTGQYSRLGALLDPVADRLLILSGMAVAWRFELLPRWAIALLIAREVFMLVLGRVALKHDVEIAINWPGRLAVAPVLAAPFFGMCGLETLGTVLLFVGLVLAVWATVLYVRVGLANSQAQRSSRA